MNKLRRAIANTLVVCSWIIDPDPLAMSIGRALRHLSRDLEDYEKAFREKHGWSKEACDD